jgi:uncharacterized membrane protein AbrB (regulator of aidB expression)
MTKPLPIIVIIIGIAVVFLGRLESNIPLWIAGFAIVIIGAVLYYKIMPKKKAITPQQEP